MSLINDALKRASEAEKRHAGLSSSGPGVRPSGRRGPKGPEALGPPMKVVPKRRREPMISSALGIAIIAICLAVIGGKLIYGWWTSRPQFALRNLPPGVDPLEAMIVTKKKKAEEEGMIHVTAAGVDLSHSAANTATNATPTNTTATNVAVVPKLPNPSTVVSNSASVISTNSALANGTNAMSPPVSVATNSPGPVKIAGSTPKSTGPSAPTILIAEANPASRTAKDLTTGLTPTAEPKAAVTPSGGDPERSFDGQMTNVDDKSEFPEIQLRGIIIKKSNATAFVNNKTMRVGDFVKDAELVEIALQYVKFTKGGVDKKYFLLR